MWILFTALAVSLMVYAFIYKSFPHISISITHDYLDKEDTAAPANTVGFVAPEEPALTKKEEEEALRSDVASMVNAIMKGDFDIG